MLSSVPNVNFGYTSAAQRDCLCTLALLGSTEQFVRIFRRQIVSIVTPEQMLSILSTPDKYELGMWYRGFVCEQVGIRSYGKVHETFNTTFQKSADIREKIKQQYDDPIAFLLKKIPHGSDWSIVSKALGVNNAWIEDKLQKPLKQIAQLGSKEVWPSEIYNGTVASAPLAEVKETPAVTAPSAPNEQHVIQPIPAPPGGLNVENAAAEQQNRLLILLHCNHLH